MGSSPGCREQGELWATACRARQHPPLLGAKGHASVSQNVAPGPRGDTVKTLKSLGATPGGCTTKLHVIVFTSQMERLLLNFRVVVRKKQGDVWGSDLETTGRGSTAWQVWGGHGNLPATWPRLPRRLSPSRGGAGTTLSGGGFWSGGRPTRAPPGLVAPWGDGMAVGPELEPALVRGPVTTAHPRLSERAASREPDDLHEESERTLSITCLPGVQSEAPEWE